MNILISSTSFIMPDNSSWSSLKEKYKIKFSEYGNLFSNNFKKSQDLEIKIIFLNDIVNYYSNSKKDFSKNANRLKKIVKALTSNLRSDKKCIICLSSYQFINIVDLSKGNNRIDNLKDFFLKEFKKISRGKQNIFLLDLDKIFSFEGYKKIFEQRNYELFRSRLSIFGVETLSNNLLKFINRISNVNKKVLLLDCDNTLWGGVLGEDGVENIKLGYDGVGNSFKNFQMAIKKKKEEGILLAIISKNDPKMTL